MPDVREAILARLTVIAGTVPGVVYARRNRGDISETSRPAIVVLDGDEAVDEGDFEGGRQATAPLIVTMTPEIVILLNERAAEIGSDLNAFRRRMIRRVLTDSTLAGLVGTSGAIRYAGCGTELHVGRSMEGIMAVAFTFRYFLKPLDLED